MGVRIGCNGVEEFFYEENDYFITSLPTLFPIRRTSDNPETPLSNLRNRKSPNKLKSPLQSPHLGSGNLTNNRTTPNQLTKNMSSFSKYDNHDQITTSSIIKSNRPSFYSPNLSPIKRSANQRRSIFQNNRAHTVENGQPDQKDIENRASDLFGTSNNHNNNNTNNNNNSSSAYHSAQQSMNNSALNPENNYLRESISGLYSHGPTTKPNFHNKHLNTIGTTPGIPNSLQNPFNQLKTQIIKDVCSNDSKANLLETSKILSIPEIRKEDKEQEQDQDQDQSQNQNQMKIDIINADRPEVLIEKESVSKETRSECNTKKGYSTVSTEETPLSNTTSDEIPSSSVGIGLNQK